MFKTHVFKFEVNKKLKARISKIEKTKENLKRKMLEEGEIDEDIDLTTESNATSQKSNSTTTNNNNYNNNNQIPSLMNVDSFQLINNKTMDSSSNHMNHKRKHKDKQMNKRKKIMNDEQEVDEELDHEHDVHKQKSPKNQGGNNFSTWASPVSKSDSSRATSSSTPATQPMSLFDLFKTNPMTNTLNDTRTGQFVDPVITEKENNKPNKLIKQLMSDMEPSQNSANLNEVSIESIEKKMEKKRKYMEMNKQKKEQQQKMSEKREQILCHFFQEGRCQKGANCPFSHNVPINKKLEICKFYLNGFCAKNEKCLYMHSDFPCKFFHRINFQTGQRKNECLNGDQCRFSHEPITNPLLREAFEKYLRESIDAQAEKKGSLTSNQTNTSESIPSLMNISVKPLNKNDNPSSPPSGPQPLMSAQPLFSKKVPLMSTNNPSLFQDVDERAIPSTITQTSDIDERSIPMKPNKVELSPPTNTSAHVVNYDLVKKELIVKIMKAIADDDGGVFSQIPKQTLTELLVKLLNSDSSSNKSDSSLSTDAIVTLLATLTAASTVKTIDIQSPLTKQTSINNDLNSSYDRYSNGDYSHPQYIDDEDDDDQELIRGNIGEFEYKMYEVDIEPSSLWINPPVDKNIIDADQECDPRIKYYSNKANCLNVTNFHLKMYHQNQLEQQNLLNVSTSSPSQQKEFGLSPTSHHSSESKTKAKIVDPRLASRNNFNVQANNQSPTRSNSPPPSTSSNLLTDFASTTNRSSASNSLLSNLPDLQLNKEQRSAIGANQSSTTSTSNQQVTDSSTVKLSIEDYKRKLQKPTGSTPSSFSASTPMQTSSVLTRNQLINESFNMNLATNSQTNSINQNNSTANTSSLPSIPSYTVNLQAPQSLHELLRNFQSS